MYDKHDLVTPSADLCVTALTPGAAPALVALLPFNQPMSTF